LSIPVTNNRDESVLDKGCDLPDTCGVNRRVAVASVSLVLCKQDDSKGAMEINSN
jgi:hypothetical protein